MTNGSLMKVESIAECFILQYFWPALSDTWSPEPIFGLFESGRFTQVLLYGTFLMVKQWNDLASQSLCCSYKKAWMLLKMTTNI